MKPKSLTRKILKDISTSKNGQDYDQGRIIGLVGSVIFMFMGLYKLILLPETFSFQEFGVGFGAFAAGIGGLLYLKKDSEPQ